MHNPKRLEISPPSKDKSVFGRLPKNNLAVLKKKIYISEKIRKETTNLSSSEGFNPSNSNESCSEDTSSSSWGEREESVNETIDLDEVMNKKIDKKKWVEDEDESESQNGDSIVTISIKSNKRKTFPPPNFDFEEDNYKKNKENTLRKGRLTQPPEILKKNLQVGLSRKMRKSMILDIESSTDIAHLREFKENEGQLQAKCIMMDTFAKVKLGCLGLSIKMSDIVYIPKKYKINPFRLPRPLTVQKSQEGESNSSQNSNYSVLTLFPLNSLYTQHVNMLVNLEITTSAVFFLFFKGVLSKLSDPGGWNSLFVVIFYIIYGILICLSEGYLKKSEKIDKTFSFILMILSKLAYFSVLIVISLYFWREEIEIGMVQFTGPGILAMNYLSSISVFGSFKLINSLGKHNRKENEIKIVLWKIMLSSLISGIFITFLGALSQIDSDYQEWTYKRVFAFTTFLLIWPLIQLLKIADLIEMSQKYINNKYENEEFWKLTSIDLISINYCFLGRLISTFRASFKNNTPSKNGISDLENNSPIDMANKWKAEAVYDEDDEDSVNKTTVK